MPNASLACCSAPKSTFNQTTTISLLQTDSCSPSASSWASHAVLNMRHNAKAGNL
jgi:hypothetical protein